MHVFLTGATGFVGSYVLRELVQQGHTVRCLLRAPGKPLSVEDGSVERRQGDVTDPACLAGTLEGCDAVIHLVGIIEEKPSQGVTFERIHQEGTRNIIAAAQSEGVDQFVYMSANGARLGGPSAYQRTKWKAEERVRKAGFSAWTIFRPSIIFGDPGERNESFEVRLARTLVRPFPVLPVFGDGTYRVQPLAVESVAAGFVQALTLEEAVEQTYCMAGSKPCTYNDLLDVITRALGQQPKPKVHLPLWLSRPFVHLVGGLGLLPISPDQFEMLLDGNTCDPSLFYRDFDVPRTSFTPEHLDYLSTRAPE